MANLDCAGQCQREHLGGVSLGPKQARHDNVGVEHDFHFRRRARPRAAISASMSEMESSEAPLAAAACCRLAWACNARTLRKSARVDSTDADAIRISTATGSPLEVMTRSSLPADLSHCFAGFFCKSLTEIVLMIERIPRGHRTRKTRPSRRQCCYSVEHGLAFQITVGTAKAKAVGSGSI